MNSSLTSYSKGTKKVSFKDNEEYKKTSLRWKNTLKKHQTIQKISQLYQRHNTLHLLQDTSLKKFTKGHLTPEGKISGERIRHLPNGVALARGGFSLFAKDLSFNLGNHSLWDVCFTNPSGSKTYLYSQEKIHLEQEQKYQLVQQFAQKREEIFSKLKQDILSKDSEIYLALYILLKTAIRVGNNYSYQNFGHKGLTTLQKKDVSLHETLLEIRYLGKDGVPQLKTIELDYWVLQRVIHHLKKKQKQDFLFTASNNTLYHGEDFSKILFEYTGIHFYPHIIRSYEANKICDDFLKEHQRKKITPEQAKHCFTIVAQRLGHKTYDKKKKLWKLDPKVSIDSYIYPKTYDKIMNSSN